MGIYSILAIGSALFYAGRYMYRINDSQYRIVIVVSGNIYKFSIQGVTLKLTYNIKNPTATNMKMTPPLIVLSINGKQVGTSNMEKIDIPEQSRDSSGKILIQAGKETGAIETEVLLKWLDLAMISPALVKRFVNYKDPKAKKIKVKVDTSCRIYTIVGNVSFPYQQTNTIDV